MYHGWLEALVDTAAECDPEFTDALRAQWREVVGAGMRLMQPTPATA
jgi:hypothetical protein